MAVFVNPPGNEPGDRKCLCDWQHLRGDSSFLLPSGLDRRNLPSNLLPDFTSLRCRSVTDGAAWLFLAVALQRQA